MRRPGWPGTAYDTVPRGLRSLIGVGLLLVTAAGGCASWYAADADREVNAVLAKYTQRVLANRSDWVQRPATLPDEPDAPADAEPADPGETLLIDLPTALQLAFTSSRDFLDRSEGLYVDGLGYTLTRYNFGPILNATISYLWQDAEDTVGSDSHALALGASQVLPTGGDLTFSAGLTGDRTADRPPMAPQDEDFTYNSNMQVNLRQPLLRGAGFEVAWESLTQGKRDLVYAVRSFELFRQDFCIRIVEGYYRLVSQKLRLANDEQNYKDAVSDREKAEALRSLDRNTDNDVFLARRREIEAEDALLVARTEYKLALDDFRILLGSPAGKVIVQDEQPEFQPVRFDAESAVKVALLNRLDLHTQRDRVDDARRQVRIARNALLPDVSLSAQYGLDGGPGDVNDTVPEQWSASMGLEFELPLDRKAERNAYRAALITLQQARRTLERRCDEIERDIFDQLRQLSQVEKRIDLQRKQIEFEQRAVAVTEIRYNAGDVSNRDKLEARQGLINAQNRLIDLKVQHFIARLRLARDLGILFVDENGMWRS